MRVQLEFNEQAVRYLDDMKARTGAVSRAEVMKEALAILHWAIDKATDGYTILAVKEGSEVAKELSMPVLEATRVRTSYAGAGTADGRRTG